MTERTSWHGTVGSGSASAGGGANGTVTLGRSAPFAVLAVALSVLVAVSMDGVRLLATPIDLAAEWTIGVRVLGGIAIVLGMLALGAQRRRLVASGYRGADPTLVGMRSAAVIMVLVTMIGMLDPPPAAPGEDGPSAGGLGLPSFAPMGIDGPGGGELDATTRGGDPLIQGSGLPGEFARPGLPSGAEPAAPGLLSRMGRFLPWFLFLALFFVVMRMLRRPPRTLALDVPEEPVAKEHAEAALLESLEKLEAEATHPRGQITLAYHHLLAALARRGAGRYPQEAPHEHLRRTLGPIGVRPEWLHRLAALYVLAQFGGVAVTDDHRGHAAEALQLSLADLRQAERSESVTSPGRPGFAR